MKDHPQMTNNVHLINWLNNTSKFIRIMQPSSDSSPYEEFESLDANIYEVRKLVFEWT